ncbi:MAG: ATP-dependent sacrificial sulfur transferase LarE [Desulfobacterales bacterium]
MSGSHHDSVTRKYEKLKTLLAGMQRVLIAFSGGVDSTLLLKVAVDVLNENALAATAVSDTTSRHERRDAEHLAEQMGVHHLMVESQELEMPEFIKNPVDKCYICKKHRFSAIKSLADKHGCLYVLDGGNLDDQRDFRPGIRALEELDVRSPLFEAEMTKSNIRRLSQQLGLPTWNKPSFACLASRIPYHQRITPEKLHQVDVGEDFLRELDFSPQLRVRHYGDTARLEIAPDDIQKLVSADLRDRIVDYFKGLGFAFVTLDLEGYTMGSLNRVLNRSNKEKPIWTAKN